MCHCFGEKFAIRPTLIHSNIKYWSLSNVIRRKNADDDGKRGALEVRS